MKFPNDKMGQKQQKTTVMRTVEKVNIFLDGENSSTVTNCKLLIVLITNDSYTNEDIKTRISSGKATLSNLTRNQKTLTF
jgi:hypothetical protein